MTKDEAVSLFEYKDGDLYWKKCVSNRAPIGSKVGTITPRGYVQMSALGVKTFVHRVVWCMFNGSIPAGKYIDHINGIRNDNRIENLRLATKAQNQHNTKVTVRNKGTGIKNVFLIKSTGKFEVSLTIKRKKKYFGVFDDLELAILVAEEAREKYHKEFARA